jgi:hypothetical protein
LQTFRFFGIPYSNLFAGAKKYRIENPNERAVAALQLAAKHSSQPEFLCTPLSAPQGNYSFLLNIRCI